jgi:phosphoglycerate dehydrogenase-like enzyme
LSRTDLDRKLSGSMDSQQHEMGYIKRMIILVPASILPELQAPAREVAPTAELRPYEEDDSPVKDLDRAAGVLRWVAGKRFASLVAEGPQVRWLHTASAGVDHVLTPAVRQKPGLTVTDSGPAFEIAISEFVLAWMLMVSRRLPDLLERQRAHHWEWFHQKELYGQTVGIIGLGPIGRGVAARAQAFGMKTLGLRRHNASVPGVDEILTGPEGLDRLLSESDWVVLAAALTEESRALLGPAQIARMKSSAWLVNIARGGLVDEPALIEALRSGRLAGACLDVFAQEPLPSESPLWDMPNVYISPHNSSGWTEGLKERQKSLFLENLRRFAAGEALDGIVDIARGY